MSARFCPALAAFRYHSTANSSLWGTHEPFSNMIASRHFAWLLPRCAASMAQYAATGLFLRGGMDPYMPFISGSRSDSSSATLYCASTSPWCAALRDHFKLAFSSRSTSSAQPYMPPSWEYAETLPCSAAFSMSCSARSSSWSTPLPSLYMPAR